MSQNDYIKLKRILQIVSTPVKMPAVLESNNYTTYKGFIISIQVENEILKLHNLYDNKTVFDIDIDNNKNIDFNMCINTDLRDNRILNNVNPNIISVIKPPGLSVFSRPSDKKISCINNLYCKCENTICNCYIV